MKRRIACTTSKSFVRGLDRRGTRKKPHRIARELQKAFGGRARYTWSDTDRALTAIWQSDTNLKSA